MAQKKNVTLKDIAEDTNYSVTTISHVINKTRHVDQETRKAVLESIKRLGYKVTATQGKRFKNKALTIGMVIADIREEFFADLIKYTESMARNMGYNLIICDSEQNPEKELECISLLLNKGVDGLILAPADVSQKYPLLKGQNIPVVLVDRNIETENFDFVGIDNFRSTYEATKELVKHRAKNIAFIGYSEINYTIKERKAGYKTAMLEAGLFKEENILQVEYHSSLNNKSIYEFIKSIQAVDGIVCGSTVICYEVLGCIKEIFPETADKIRIITYDDNKWYNLMPHKVSAIKTPTVDAATVALELLVNKLEAPFTANVPKKILLNYEFIKRF
ncbi:MAG: LacI family transcriptional regulator [Lentisphaerae bacterium]|nr:LacI family transcriptional regulator [Lentisphaerota bacterium]MCP4101391.1 LacI family transcriptional regulator [Lentisphaerota bacterium]